MRTCEELAERVIARRDAYFEKQRKTRKTAARIGGCTLALALLIAAGAWRAGAFAPEPAVESQLPDALEPETDRPQTEPPDIETSDPTDPEDIRPVPDDGPAAPERVTVTGFDDGGVAACYVAPENGQVNLSVPLRGALDYYGDDALYQLAPHFFRDGTLVDPSDPELQEPAELLAAAGYSIEYGTNVLDGQERGFWTLELTGRDLRVFTAPEGWGLMLFLRDEWAYSRDSNLSTGEFVPPEE